jgi:hypothetical protein
MSIFKSNISYHLMEIITNPLKVSSLAAEFKARALYTSPVQISC